MPAPTTASLDEAPSSRRASPNGAATRAERRYARRLDLQGLQVFDAVMRERNVTRAAASLSLSQPALSHVIGRLRTQFGDPLFLRTAGGIKPTRRAEALWREIRGPIDSLHRVLEPEQFDPATASVTVTLAANDMLVQERLTPWCAQLLRDAPDVRVSLVMRIFGDTEARLVEGTLDFGLGLFSALPAVLRRREIWSDQYVCVVRAGHPLLRAPWTLEAFRCASHVRVLPSGERFDLADIGMRTLGIQPRVAMTVSHFTCLPGLVEASDLVAILPRFYVRTATGRHALAVLELPFPMEPVRYELVWHERSEASAPLVWFREELARQLGDPAPGTA